jgi:hypothetical protein
MSSSRSSALEYLQPMLRFNQFPTLGVLPFNCEMRKEGEKNASTWENIEAEESSFVLCVCV